MGRNDETGRGNPPRREETPATSSGRAIDPRVVSGAPDKITGAKSDRPSVSVAGESIEISSSFGAQPTTGSFEEIDPEDVEAVQTRAQLDDEGRTRRMRPEDVPPPTGAPPRDQRIGETLVGRYRLEKLIGKGGMGRVYCATQLPLNRSVAVKILSPEFQKKDPQFVRRFFLEAATAARLNHPNTITVFDYGETERGELFIAMEYLKGRALSRVLSVDGPFHAERCMYVSMQVVRALREAHAKGIIHRDLKPGNIMLLDEGDDPDYAKVLDFGLVKLFNVPGQDVRLQDLDPEPVEVGELTRAGMFLGSPKYMSPEQIQGHDLDPRTDIYSLGVIMYQMLAGRVPFRGTTSVEIIYKHVNLPVPAIHDSNPEADCPPELELVVMRCLAKNREDRFASMGDLLTALKDVRRLVVGVSSVSGAALELASHYPIRDTAQVAAEMPAGLGFGSSGKVSYSPLSVPPVPSLAPASADSAVPREASFVEPALANDESHSLELSRAERRRAASIRPKGLAAKVVPYAAAAAALIGLVAGTYWLSAPDDPALPIEPVQGAAKVDPEPTGAIVPPPPAPVEPEPELTTIRFSSKPEGAKVYDGASLIGTTPFEHEISREPGTEPEVRSFVFKKDGYLDELVRERIDADTLKILTTLRAKPADEPPPRRRPQDRKRREPPPATEYKENPY